MQPNVRSWAWIVLIVATAGAAGSGGRVRGAEPSGGGGTTESAVASLIRDLHATRYATREAATQSLMRLSAEDCPEIEAALARETDAEAATRLERAAVHLHMKSMTSLDGDVGLLGIALSVEAVQPDPKSSTVQAAIVVVKTQPGFPAAESLEVGDRILGFNGTRFTFQTNDTEFRAMINATHPGSTVQLTVLRDGKILEVQVRIAGLRAEEVPLLQAIVQNRDAHIATYAAGLKNGAAGRPLVWRERMETAPGSGWDTEGDVPADGR